MPKPTARRRRTAWALAAAALCAATSATASAQEAEPAPAPGRVLWKYAPSGSSFHDVMVEGGTVYALDRQGNAHALDAASGEARWVSDGGGTAEGTTGMSLSRDGEFSALLVGTDKGILALDPATGKKLWLAEIAVGAAGPVGAQGVAVAGSGDGQVYGVSLRTGEELWRHDYLSDSPPDPEGFSGNQARFGGQPARPGNAATDGNMVVLSIFDQCRTLALDPTTGDRLWTFQTKGWIYSRPAIGPRNIFVSSQDRHLYAVDKDTGKLAWMVRTGARNEASAAPTERFAYFGSCDANLYAVDQVVGRVAWKYQIERKERYGGPIYARPVVTDETVYLASLHGKLYAVDRAAGTLHWKMQVLADSEINSDLVTDGTHLFVSTRKDGDAGESAVVAIALQ